MEIFKPSATAILFKSTLYNARIPYSFTSSKVKRIELFTGYSNATTKGDIESNLFSSAN